MLVILLISATFINFILPFGKKWLSWPGVERGSDGRITGVKPENKVKT